MAKIPFAFGLALDSQSGFGTVNSTIKGLADGGGSGTGGEIISVDGLILGSRDAGDANTGITLPTFEREGQERADVAGSFTKTLDSFLRQVPNGFDVTFEFKGNGRTAGSPPVDADFHPVTAFDAMLRAAGTTPSAGATQGTGGAGQTYQPAALLPASAKLWFGSSAASDTVAVVLMDLVASGFSLEITPGGLALVTVTFEGKVESESGGNVFPTFDAAQIQATPTTGDGNQTISAPVAQSIGNSWSTTRGFAGPFTIEVSQTIEDVPDSNAVDGIEKLQTDRTVELSGPIYVDDAGETFEKDQLTTTSLPSTPLSFTVGTAAADGETIDAFFFQMDHPLAREVKYNSVGNQLVAEVTLEAKDDTADQEAEFQLI